MTFIAGLYYKTQPKIILCINKHKYIVVPGEFLMDGIEESGIVSR